MAITRRATSPATDIGATAPPPGILARTRTRIAASDAPLPGEHPLQPVANQEEAPGIGHNQGPALDVAAANVEAAKALLADFHRANVEVNAASRKVEAAKKALNVAMVKGDIKHVAADVLVGSAVVPVEARIEAKEEEFISVEKLEKLVSPAMFRQIISATKTAVIAMAGENVCIQATDTRMKTRGAFRQGGEINPLAESYMVG